MGQPLIQTDRDAAGTQTTLYLGHLAHQRERLFCNQEVTGLSPVGSTNHHQCGVRNSPHNLQRKTLCPLSSGQGVFLLGKVEIGGATLEPSRYYERVDI